MKMTWKKKSGNKRLAIPNLPFEKDEDLPVQSQQCPSCNNTDSSLADAFLEQGNKLAEDGKYHKALGKWESAITLMPEKAVLHEQKAQVLLEIGDSWGALKAATRATELDSSWAEPGLVEPQEDRQTALQLVKQRKQIHLSGLSTDNSRYTVSGGGEANLPGCHEHGTL